MLRSTRFGVLALSCALVLSGCAGTSSTDDESRDRSSSKESTLPTQGIGSALNGFGTRARTAGRKGDWDLVLRDVRIGEHDRFDRLVLEFEGKGKPGWSVRYGTPRLDGSGQRVRLKGRAFLTIVARGTTMRPEGAEDGQWDLYDGPARLTPRTAGISAVRVTEGPFEGDHQVFLGTAKGKVPFRVMGLTNPSRLVVDLKTS